MNEPDTTVRIDIVTRVDSLEIFDEVAHSNVAPNGVAEVVRSTWGGVVDLPSDNLPRLRYFTALNLTGLLASQSVRGHELDSADSATFRIYRSERGQRVCVAAFDRRQVLGIVETEALPSTNNGAVNHDRTNSE